MKRIVPLTAAAAGLIALAACHNGTTTTNTASDNGAMMTSNYDAGMGNASAGMDAAAGSALNAANSTIANGQNMATDLRTHDPDMNLANGM